MNNDCQYILFKQQLFMQGLQLHNISNSNYFEPIQNGDLVHKCVQAMSVGCCNYSTMSFTSVQIIGEYLTASKQISWKIGLITSAYQPRFTLNISRYYCRTSTVGISETLHAVKLTSKVTHFKKTRSSAALHTMNLTLLCTCP